MSEPGTCDIFTTAEAEIRTFTTYKCGLCPRLADPSLEGLAAHWWVDHGINAKVSR